MDTLREFWIAVAARRVADRYLEGKVFGTPDALREYLREHPNADPSKHEVRKPEKSEPSKDEGKAKPTMRERIKALPEKAKTFLAKAPDTVARFVSDPEFRQGAIRSAQDTLRNLPAKTYEAAKTAIKGEIEDYKTATAGLRRVMGGQPMSDAEKKAMKSVAFNTAFTVAAVAVSSGIGLGVRGLAVAAFDSFCEGAAKKVVLNTLANGLGKVVDVNDWTNFGVDVVRAVTADEKPQKKPDDKDLMVAYITALVHEQIANLTDQDVAAILEEVAQGEERV